MMGGSASQFCWPRALPLCIEEIGDQILGFAIGMAAADGQSPPDLESLASREGRTARSIRMTLSLAFLAPEIVKTAVEGRLPRGYGLKRLVALPMAWLDQWCTLGLQAPAQP
jgi:hypothetical protein